MVARCSSYAVYKRFFGLCSAKQVMLEVCLMEKEEDSAYARLISRHRCALEACSASVLVWQSALTAYLHSTACHVDHLNTPVVFDVLMPTMV